MILRPYLLAAALQCAFLTQPFAQEAPSCDGTWKYTHIDKARGRTAEVEVRITGDKGTYVAHLGQHKGANSPCREKSMPVIVRQCTADEFVFRVLGEDVLQGCPTFTARFKRTGPDTAEGTISRDQTVTAHRER